MVRCRKFGNVGFLMLVFASGLGKFDNGFFDFEQNRVAFVQIMGCSGSKNEKSEALRLCRERKKFIKQAMDSRYAVAAAHLSYCQSLHDVGIALGRFAEAQVLIESSLSTSATELEKTPCHSSYASPSASHNAETSKSPLNDESPLSPRLSTMSFMRSGGTAVVTVQINPSFNRFEDDDSLGFPLPPPPPPPPEPGSSWDFFDPLASAENLMFHGEKNCSPTFDRFADPRRLRFPDARGEAGNEWGRNDLKEKDELFTESVDNVALLDCGRVAASAAAKMELKHKEMARDKLALYPADRMANGGQGGALATSASSPQCSSKENNGMEEGEEEREDPSEFITHRAKDFLSSIKDIVYRFERASESGKEVSRMLEANKIQINSSEAKGRSQASIFLAACHLVCCRGESVPAVHDPPQHVSKVITWTRSMSSQSSSSKNLLVSGTRDDDSSSDFIEEFYMISGRHSSTLERLYAWERKLYDEVKATEIIGKEYDEKCSLLRHQFAQDLRSQAIDKTRATVKDLYSRLKVAIHAVNSISKRIEKLRDEELQPQLLELIQGLIRMWKAMLECHHAQYITISLAYHSKSSTAASQNESHRQVLNHLQSEIECFSSTFVDWMNAIQSYVDAVNGWLQNCFLQSQEQERSSRRRWAAMPSAVDPAIFVLFREWSNKIKVLPSKELTDGIKAFASELRRTYGLRVEEMQKQPDFAADAEVDQPSESKEYVKGYKVSNLISLQASLAHVFDGLTKFSQESLKMYEEIRQECQDALNRISKMRS